MTDKTDRRPDAAETERELREHEREAREHDEHDEHELDDAAPAAGHRGVEAHRRSRRAARRRPGGAVRLLPRDQAMWTTAGRDAPLVESLGEIMNRTWFTLLDRAVDVLSAARGLRGSRRRRAVGAFRLVVDFPTWHSLTRSGLADTEAAEVATAFVAASTGPAVATA